MATIKSDRAKKLLESSRFFSSELTSGMRRFPGEAMRLWVEVEWGGDKVKKLSLYGEVDPWQKVLLESMASLMVGQPLARLEQLSLRECEAFLRDRNSELALEGLAENAEGDFKKLFTWLRLWPAKKEGEDYVFPREKGPFGNLKLADKVRELKGFLNSAPIIALYQGLPLPELVDVDGLTVFIEAPYHSERERALFEELHVLGTEAFQEEELNFIPEG